MKNIQNLNNLKANLISPNAGQWYRQISRVKECIPIPIKTSPVGERSKEIYYGVTTT